jgi:hypothetical protein
MYLVVVLAIVLGGAVLQAAADHWLVGSTVTTASRTYGWRWIWREVLVGVRGIAIGAAMWEALR